MDGICLENGEGSPTKEGIRITEEGEEGDHSFW